MTDIGIPYATVDIDTGERICPECGARIAEDYDNDGEQTTNFYALHYEQEHQTIGNRRTPPAGWRHERESSETACPHRDLSVCPPCEAANPEAVDVSGQHYWLDAAEREELFTQFPELRTEQS